MYFREAWYAIQLIAFVCIFGKSGSVKIEIDEAPKYYTPLASSIYLTGSFNEWTESDPKYKMERHSFDKFRIEIDLPEGTYTFKFNRGDFETNETTLNGESVERELTITSDKDLKLKFTVENWADMVGEHSAVGNVYILDEDFPYPQFRTTKSIYLYLPSDYHTTNKTYPVFYIHDGRGAFDRFFFDVVGLGVIGELGVDETLEEFHKQNKDTAIVVAIDTFFERSFEMTPYPFPYQQGGMGDKYMDFIINDLKPFIDENFRTKPDRKNTGIIGASFGGLISNYAGLVAQDVFGMIGPFSPSLWVDERMFRLAETLNLYNDTKYYFCSGLDERPTWIKDLNRMIDILKRRGNNNIGYSIDTDGEHTVAYWRRVTPKALKWFLEDS